MNNHTPGPWTIGESETRIPIKSGSRTVAYVQISRNDYENAHMISATPDLLKNLKEAYRLAVAHGWAPAHREGWAAAIAKAEGQS